MSVVRQPEWTVSVDGAEPVECYAPARGGDWDEISVPGNLLSLMTGKRVPLRFQRDDGQGVHGEGIVVKVTEQFDGRWLSTIALSGPLLLEPAS